MTMNTTKITDGQNCTITPLQLVTVPLANGTTTIGIILRILAENHAVIAYVDEHGNAHEEMRPVDDSE